METEEKDLGEVLKELNGTRVRIKVEGYVEMGFDTYREIKTDHDLAAVLLDIVNALTSEKVEDTEIF